MIVTSVRPPITVAPPADDKHVPLIEKHPFARSIPWLKVDVAVPVWFSASVSIPPVNVVVPEFVNVLAVYVFGIVVDEFMYELTLASV